MDWQAQIDKKRIDAWWRYVCDRLFYARHGLIYDHVLDELSYFPTKEEAEAAFPNPCGYGTGMEDSMINNSSMLLACLGKYGREGDDEALEMMHRLVRGVLGCQSKARSHGFLPRSIVPTDGESHYIDSSRDQYTLCIYAMHRYLASGLATEEERDGIAKMLVSFAERAEKNVTLENGYDLLREDGMPTVCTVMWGDTLGNHEMLRLPMIYLAAWQVSGNAHWLAMYEGLREEGYLRSMPMTGRYWHLYTLQQMQMSVRLCYDLDPDATWREKFGELLTMVADYVMDNVQSVRQKLFARVDYNSPYLSFHDVPLAPRKYAVAGNCPNLSPVRAEYDAFFILQDAINVMTTVALCPDRAPSEDAIRLFGEALARMDENTHVTSVPVQVLEAYYGETYRME